MAPKSIKNLLLLVSILSFASACTPSSKEGSKGEPPSAEVNIYSQRHYDADKEVLKRFTEKTGVVVNLVKAGADELINRMEIEGVKSPADVFIAVDAARLNRAVSKGLLQKVAIDSADVVREEADGGKGYWYPITYRARIIAYRKDKVDSTELSTYEDLSSDKWNDQIVIRSSSSGYNQSLLASLIAVSSEGEAEAWAQGVVKNMARDPKGGDRDQIKALAAGTGTIAVVNTYYLGQLLNSDNPEEVAAGEAVGVFFPNQDGRGTHINVSGVGVAKNAPNKENAKKLIEFLLSDEIQAYYAAHSFEYPASKHVEADSTIAAFGKFKADGLQFASDMALTEKAVMIFDRVGWK